MAGDWIKVRVLLPRDPCVIEMANWIAEQREFIDWLLEPVRQGAKTTAHECVTRNVTRALCVTGLIVTWGVARERGDREGDDLVLRNCCLETIDDVADVPCFGLAMEHVGWAIERADGCVVFPKYFKDNESPDDRHKRQAAARQASFRAKHNVTGNSESNVTQNVTVTDEKRREEKRRTIDTSVSIGRKKLDAPSADHEAIAATLGVNCQAEFLKFKDWLASSGKSQKDEGAGFRNWLRRASTFKPASTRSSVAAELFAGNQVVIDAEAKRVA